MPEQLRALVVILILAAFTFFFARKMTASIIATDQFNRWRNAWLGVTLILFLAGNFWLYLILIAAFLLYLRKQENNIFALYIVLLFASPKFINQIPGFGIVNYLFAVDYATILSLTLLLPAYLTLRQAPENSPFLKFWADKLLLAYLVLDVLLLLRDTTVTDAMRSVLFNFTEVFLPYYVASRSIKNLQQLKEIFIAFTVAGMLAGIIGMFEYSKHWLLYANLPSKLGITWASGKYLDRGDSLRALATSGQPIVLGYIMMLALGFYIYLAKQINNKYLRWLGWFLIIGGLYAALSRGPWVGAAILILSLIIISPKSTKHLSRLVIAAIVIIPLLSSLPIGHKVIDMLPFIGKTDVENVDYRVRLFENSMIVFNRYPLFGSTTYIDELAGMGMVQGEGIVDIVNTYLIVLLKKGLVGILLFVGFFSLIVFSIFRQINTTQNEKEDTVFLGRILFAILIAILVTITTVSDILVIPILYWSVAGLCISYKRLTESIVSNKLEAELRAYRLAFDVLPAIPTQRLAFSALTKHRIAVDTKPMHRLPIKRKSPPEIKPDLKINLVHIAKGTSVPRLSNVPSATDIYQLARANRPNVLATAPTYSASEAVTKEKISNTSITNTPAVNSLTNLSKIQIISGTIAGRELLLQKVLTKIGKAGLQLALISKRESGYFIRHLEGNNHPIINGISIGESQYELKDQDVIEIAGIQMKYLMPST